MRTVRPDVTVVGGGILGAMVTYVLSVRFGLRTVMIRKSDKGTPQAETLRNHAWLQSGLLYLDAEPRWLPTKMYRAGVTMLEEFGVPLPSTPSIFRVESDEKAEAFLAKARRLAVGAMVSQVESARKLAWLTDRFHEDGRPAFYTPDSPFSEAELLEAAFQAILGEGNGSIKEVSAPATLERDAGFDGGCAVRVDGTIYDSPVTVLAAGAGTPSLLKSLEIETCLGVYRSPLLVVGGNEHMKVPMLVDLDSGLAVASHTPRAAPPDGRLVIGNRERKLLTAQQVAGPRKVTADDQNSILGLLTDPDDLLRGRMHRFTAGYKVEAHFRGDVEDLAGKPRVVPWSKSFQRYEGLIAAVPGKATMSLYHAEQIAAEVERLLGRTPHADTGHNFMEHPPYTGPARPRMHHHSEYDDLNEATNGRPGESSDHKDENDEHE